MGQPAWVGPEAEPSKPVGRYSDRISDQFVIWRPIMEGKVTLGEVNRSEVGLAELIVLNQLLDAQAAAEFAAYRKGK